MDGGGERASSFAPALVFLSGARRGATEFLTEETVQIRVSGEGDAQLVGIGPGKPSADLAAGFGHPVTLARRGSTYELRSTPGSRVWVNGDPVESLVLASGDVVEKPFGSDLESAKKLNEAVHAVFRERQIYRIDHYLGKETSQNILFFRFGNTVFEPLWNRNYVDHVQLTVAETVDVEHRAGFYDGTGVLRDMFQNHLLQLLALVAMEPPASFEADAIRNERVKVLSAIRPLTPASLVRDAVRGQYWGYREGEGVAEGSDTPTYAALKLQIDNWRWQGVPFYL
jgi:hypothetical protein